MLNYKSGFTLAEVLITLVIIGVVAALTIPTAINRMQREELRSQFKKVVNTTFQAVQKMKIDYGIIYDVNNDTAAGFRDKFEKYFSLNCASNCYTETTFHNFNNVVSSQARFYLYHSFITNDGAYYAFSISSYYVYMAVDINGLGKKPNRLGYDIFMFYFTDNHIKPCGINIPGSAMQCGTSSNEINGMGCTAKALSDPNYFKNLP